MKIAVLSAARYGRHGCTNQLMHLIFLWFSAAQAYLHGFSLAYKAAPGMSGQAESDAAWVMVNQI